MQKTLCFSAIVVFLFLAFTASTDAVVASKTDAHQTETHYQKGMRLYRTGFYEFMPRNQQKQAYHYYQLAEKEFILQLHDIPSDIPAGLALARVYHVQKKYLKAAKQYQKMTELDPANLDTYALAAASFAKAEHFRSAEDQVKAAMALAKQPRGQKALRDLYEKLVKQRKAHEKRKEKEAGHE
jgi:tetratricopeptide (TPR) repeat protein